MVTNPVAIVGFFRSELGIGQSARRAADSIEAVGRAVSRHTVPVKSGLFDQDIAVPNVSVQAPAGGDILYHLNPPDLVHVVPAWRARIRAPHRIIGFWHWELPAFPASWAPALDLVDEIWTPSRFGAGIFAPVTSKPVRVVPHAVPANDLNVTLARARLGLPRDRRLFLVICDTNSSPARKNPRAAVRAFQDAFPTGLSDSPLLVLKLHGRRYRHRGLQQFLANAGTDPRIIVLDKVMAEDDMRALQAACDCYVSLHRSECFGLNIAECMAAGKPVIVTDFSGNTDFTTTGNALLIPWARRDVRAGEYPAHAGQWWAEPDHDAAVAAMRAVVEEPARVARFAANARRDVRGALSYANVGRMIVSTLTSGNQGCS